MYENKNPFIYFLNKYCPTSGAHENIFEEYVLESKFTLDIETKTEKFLREEFLKENPRHVILTGNAGDGKTRIGKKIFSHLFPKRKDELIKEDQFKGNLNGNGKEIFYIKDLSVFSEKETQEILIDLYNSIINEENKIFFIAANEGKLHHNLNQLGKEYSELKNWILNEIRSIPGIYTNSIKNDKFKKNIVVINLNHVTNSVYLKDIIKQINKKENWEACENCSLKGKCIIYWNYNQLQKDNIINRLEEIYKIIENQDIHLTFRDLLNHITYTYTGGLYCKDINEKERSYINNKMYYLNFLGDSIEQEEIFEKIFAFKYVKQLQIGKISTLIIDKLILEESNQIKELLENEIGFGIDEFNTLKEKLRKEILKDYTELNKWLTKLRKKLFFEYNNDNKDIVYNLLPFQHYKVFIELNKNFEKVAKKIKSQIIQALNNNFSDTYLLIKGSKHKELLYLTIKIDNFSLKTIPILLKRFLEEDVNFYPVIPNFEYLDHNRVHFIIDIENEKLDISLNLFDYLSRVSNGGLSNILSEENDLLIKDFKDRLISKVLLNKNILNKYLKIDSNFYEEKDLPKLTRE